MAAVGACKGDRKQCEAACRNYATLVYPKVTEAEIAKLPEAEREAARRKKAAAFSSQLENGVETCINQCASANNDEQIDCMIQAKTADQATACAED